MKVVWNKLLSRKKWNACRFGNGHSERLSETSVGGTDLKKQDGCFFRSLRDEGLVCPLEAQLLITQLEYGIPVDG